MSDWNLSDCRRVIVLGGNADAILIKDIREFIKRLKEIIFSYSADSGEEKMLVGEIDKLAGDKLI